MIQGHTGVTEVTGGEIVRYFFIAHVVRFFTFLHVKKNNKSHCACNKKVSNNFKRNPK